MLNTSSGSSPVSSQGNLGGYESPGSRSNFDDADSTSPLSRKLGMLLNNVNAGGENADKNSGNSFHSITDGSADQLNRGGNITIMGNTTHNNIIRSSQNNKLTTPTSSPQRSLAQLKRRIHEHQIRRSNDVRIQRNLLLRRSMSALGEYERTGQDTRRSHFTDDQSGSLPGFSGFGDGNDENNEKTKPPEKDNDMPTSVVQSDAMQQDPPLIASSSSSSSTTSAAQKDGNPFHEENCA